MYMYIYICCFSCTEEDQQSFAVPSTPGDSSLNLSSVGSQEEVNQESINRVLNFSANLTQAAEKCMST